jgi:Flp pilus assembly protein TadG
VTRRRRNEQGYVAIFTAVLFAALFSGLAATAVDTASWYLEAQKVQNAADAAALAGVVYMPQDLTTATSTAEAAALRNGYSGGDPNITVTTQRGSTASQLKVTVTSRIHNTFGALIGVPTATISRAAVADFTGPAPMGSPCNTFGNEPLGGTGSSAATPSGSALGLSPFANCSSNPQFWANVQGPETGKVQHPAVRGRRGGRL